MKFCSSYKIEKSVDGLIVHKTRLSELATFIFMVLFFVLWYYILLFSDKNVKELSEVWEYIKSNLHVLIFCIFPLLMIPGIFSSLENVIKGWSFHFNKSNGLILRNQKSLASIADVEKVQIRVIHDSEGGDDYRLSLILKNDQKIYFDTTSEYKAIVEVAEEMADICEVKVVKK